MKVKTRVWSVSNASASRSNISEAWSSNDSGTPTGAGGTSSIASGLPLGLLDPALRLAHVLEVLVQPRAIARPHRARSSDSPR